MSDTYYNSLNTDTLPGACSCNECSNITSGSGTLDNDTTTDEALYAPTVAATPTEFADYLINGFWSDRGSVSRQWDTSSDNTITFSIKSGYTTAQQEGFRMAFDQWSDVADIQFVEVSSGSDADIDIYLGSDGRAYSSSSVYVGSGDIASNYISIDASVYGWQNIGTMGDYALLTAIHEIGHSLGLGHTGNYNGSATYASDAQYTNDSHQYSVMSYFSASNTGADHQGAYASTPMIYDILAMQTIYGVNYDTRSGDTVYGFNSTADRDQFDFTINTTPVVAIWDGAGTDTIDLSGWSDTQMINLNDGAFSSVGGGTGNLSIAIGAEIENAVGGSGIDTIYGNELANTITGGAGDDIIYGSLGDDTIDGGDDSDTISYSDSLNAFTLARVNSTTVTLTHNTDGYTDTISNIETYDFNGTTYTHAELLDLLNVDYVKMTFLGEDSAWKYQMSSIVAGEFSFDSNDVGDGGSTSYTTGNRSSNSTLTIQNVDNNVEYAYMSSYTITDLTISGYEAVEVYERNAGGVTMTLNNVQSGKAYTGIGNDTITISATMVDYSDSTTYRIESSSGNDTINYSSDNVIVYGVIYAGVGDDEVNITSAGEVYAELDDGDDTYNGGSGYDRVSGGIGMDIIYGNDGTDHLSGNDGQDSLYGGAGVDYLYGNAGDDYIEGGADDDRIYGGTDDDEIYGGLGADRLYGEAGNDEIYGDDGEDYIDGGDGNDQIWGGLGDDRLNGKMGNDIIYGGDGADRIYSHEGDDFVYGDAGDDYIATADGIDYIEGGDGADTVYAGRHDDTVYGGAGEDSLYGYYGMDTIYGGDDNDYIDGEADNDTINGDAGDDEIYGGYGDDTMYGGEGNDRVDGQNDDDTLYGGAGDDTIYGGSGGDTMYGEDGNDFMSGQDGTDYLSGGAGNDTLYGGANSDTLIGGLGSDSLSGGDGDDLMIGVGDGDSIYGNAGADTFALTDYNSGRDRFYDFDLTEGDSINITDVLIGYVDGVSDINDYVYFNDRGSYTDMMISREGNGSFYQAVSIYDGNTLDGYSVDDLIASGDLVANSTVF